MAHMAQLRRDYDKFVTQNTEVIIFGPENKNAFARFWQMSNMPYIGVPDPDRTVLNLYGQEVNLFKFGRMPAHVVIDKQGKVRFAHYGSSMADIPSNDEILKLLKSINAE